MPIPPIKEQDAIGRQVDLAIRTITRFGHEVENGLAEVTSLDQSILAKAFRGELVPQDPNDEPAETLLARIQAETRPPNTQKGGRVRRS
jgi:type I restriction enzyme S subunit